MSLYFSVSGDVRLFESLRRSLETGLPSEAIEWKRSFGRASKNVIVDAKFIPFKPDISASFKSLLEQPILHTYWIESPVSDLHRLNEKES
jgi:hypothetical protein